MNYEIIFKRFKAGFRCKYFIDFKFVGLYGGHIELAY